MITENERRSGAEGNDDDGELENVFKLEFR